MKRTSSVITAVFLLLCLWMPSSVSAKYCNRAITQYGTKDFVCGYRTSSCTFHNFDFRRHALGLCIAGTCYDGEGTAWLNPGVYEGRFRNGYPEGEGVMHRGAPDSSGRFVETLVLKGKFYDGCMKYDVRATLPNSAIYWDGTFDEETGASTGTWLLSVTNPGHNVPPLRLINGGLAQQPTEGFAAAALRDSNARPISSSMNPGAGSSPVAARTPEPPREMARPVPDENTPGPLPMPGDAKGDANNAFMYLVFPSVDRTAPMSPHSEALFKPVYLRALELYDNPDPEVSRQAASAIGNMYERGWFVAKNYKTSSALSSYAYSGGSKPVLPKAGADRPAALNAVTSVNTTARAAAMAQAMKGPFAVGASDYQTLQKGYDYLTGSEKFDPQVQVGTPLTAKGAAELRPFVDNLVRIYNTGSESDGKTAGYQLSVFYERGWVLPQDDDMVRALRIYHRDGGAKPGLRGLAPCADDACRFLRNGGGA